MITTQSFLALLPRVVRFSDIRFVTVRSIDNMEIMARAYGADHIIKSGSLTAETLAFLTRFEVNVLDKPADRWSSSYARKKTISVLSNTLEEIPAIITAFLDTNPQYFKTFTDEWGRTYGESK